MSALKPGPFSSALMLLMAGGPLTGHFEVTGHLVCLVQTWVWEDRKQGGQATGEPELSQVGEGDGESAVPVTSFVACSEGCF